MKSPRLFFSNFFSYVFFVVLISVSSSAFAQTGNVSGVVLNQNGDALGGASIRIAGQNRQTSSDDTGRYRFTSLPIGEHQAVITYFGSSPFSVYITVQAGENNNVDLAASNDYSEEVIVMGVRGSIYASRSRERAADGFKSVIASDSVGQFGDQNIAEALQRVPGLSITRSEGEGNFVSVRGLAPGFNQVTQNGVAIGTDGDTRGASLQFVGTNMLSSVEVTKSLTPDLSASSVGGQINILSASAFRAGENTLSVGLEGSYQDDAAQVSPKLDVSGTYITGIAGGEENFGIAYAFNYYDRYINGNEWRNDDDFDLRGPNEEFAFPGEFDNRREIGERERLNVYLGLEYRPTEQDEFSVHGTVARVYDNDLKLREEWETDRANENEQVLEISTGSFVATNTRQKSDTWLQEIENESYTFDFGGKHTRGDWTYEYILATSEARSDREGSARIRWQTDDIATRGTFGSDFNTIEAIPFDEAQLLPGVNTSIVDGRSTPENRVQNLAWFDDSLGGEEVNTVKFDITKDFLWGDTSGYFKFGGLLTDSSVDNDENRPNFDPDSDAVQAAICGTDEACIAAMTSTVADFPPLEIPENSILRMPMPIWENVESFIESQRPLAPAALVGDQFIDDFKRDYTASEEVTAFYVMVSLDFTEQFRLIAGVRSESTEFTTAGYFSLENDDYVLPNTVKTVDIVESLGTFSKSYTNVFPNLTLRYTPVEEVILRAAIWGGLKRPTFSEAQNSATIDSDITFISIADGSEIEPDDLVTDEDFANAELQLGGRLDLGNPDLEPMVVQNFDLSVGWYPSDSTYLSLAFYYKDIEDFATRTTLGDASWNDLPVRTPDVSLFPFDTNAPWDQIRVVQNGDEAEVTGFEFAFSHTFDSGFFVEANAAIIDSDSTLPASFRPDKLPLVGQADNTANLSFGYENELFSVRLAANQRGKTLIEIYDCQLREDACDPEDKDQLTSRDIYSPEYNAMDLNIRYNATENLQVYFDAINLTAEKEIRQYKGTPLSGPLYERIEDYGSTYQLGVRYIFF